MPLIMQPWLIMLRWTWAVGPTLAGRALLGPGVDDPVLLVQVEVGLVLEEGEVRLPVRLDRADVLPVALEAVAVDAGAGRRASPG